MRNGKYAAPRKRRGNAKVLVTLLALTLVLGCVVGGTIAWLTDTTGPIANTFTIGDINISLSGDDVFKTNSPNTVSTGTVTTYVPGQTITTKPTVTVKAGSEACFLFIHIEEKNNTFGTNEKVIQWDLWTPPTGSSSDNWTKVEGHSGYYYRKVGKVGTDNANYEIFKDSALIVNEDLKKSDIDTMKANGNYPTITITAAAVQKENIPDSNGNNAIGWKDAWELLPEGFKPSGT